MLQAAYGGVTALLAGLDEADLLRPSRCAGWVVVDVAAHLLMDAERALMACATPADGAAAVDAAGYFRRWADGQDDLAAARGARFVRIQASAYRGPQGLLAHWRDTAEAAARAVGALPPDAVVATQGTTLTMVELERTLVLETVVHHLDMTLELASAPAPDPACLDATYALLGELAGTPLPEQDQTGWVLRAAGRLPCQAPWDARLPVLR